MTDRPTPLVLVGGLHRAHTARAADALLTAAPGTVAVHHDVCDLTQGVVVRTVRTQLAGEVTERRTAVELAHGCLSCTLRLDLLPLVRELAGRDGVERIVLQLDPALEPEHLCWALRAVVLAGGGTAADAVAVEAVLAVLDAGTWLGTWLDDVTGEELVADRGIAATADDELVRFSARRPFHPQRLHEAFDVLLDGVVGSRGRMWLATRHDRAVWLESAGGGLQVGDAGPWLDTLGDDAGLWAQVDPERRVAAALRWDPLHGDRDTELVVLTHRQSREALTAALAAALLTDEELALGPAGWDFDDPFGDHHDDPCEASSPAGDPHAHTTEENR